MADVRLLLSALDVVEEENAELRAENERLQAGLGINKKYREELEALKAELAEIRQSHRDAYKHSDDLK